MTSTLTATVPRTPEEIEAKRVEVLARAKVLGWSQSELSRRVGRNPGTSSRVLRGLLISAPWWQRAEQVLAEAERAAARKRRPRRDRVA